MYHYPLLILTLTAMSAGIPPLAAHVGDRLYPISYLSQETLAHLDQDDASLEDWMEAVGNPTLTTLDFALESRFSRETSYDQYDPSNLDFRIWLGWSRDGKIHVAGQFADNVYYNEYGSGRYGPEKTFSLSDHLTLMVDGDHSGGLYWFSHHGKELEGPLETNMQAQYYKAISQAAGDPLVDLRETTYHAMWMVQLPFARGGGSVLGENPTFWSVEFYVTCFDLLNHLSPEDSDVSQLTEGKIIGFDFWVSDYDEDSILNLYYLDRPEDFKPDAHDANTMVDGLLLGPAGGSGDSAVQSVSWGRIKASLGIDLRREHSLTDKD